MARDEHIQLRVTDREKQRWDEFSMQPKYENQAEALMDLLDLAEEHEDALPAFARRTTDDVQ